MDKIERNKTLWKTRDWNFSGSTTIAKSPMEIATKDDWQLNLLTKHMRLWNDLQENGRTCSFSMSLSARLMRSPQRLMGGKGLGGEWVSESKVKPG